MRYIFLFLISFNLFAAEQILNLKAKGLYSYPNEFSEVPLGALTTAKNVDILRNGTIQSRRGFEQVAELNNNNPDNIFFYESQTIVHYGSSLAYYDSTNSNFVPYSGTYDEPDATLSKMHAVQASNNFYFLTDEGMKKLDTYTATPRSAGIPQALGAYGSLTAVASGFLPDDDQVAYRVVWSYEDNQGNLILGAPSQRIVVSNSSGSAEDVILEITIPSGITTAYEYQVYRSALSGAAATEPDDELRLVYTGNPESADITAGYLTITDNTPETLRIGAELYTNAGQETIAASNYEPPLAKDIAFYKNYLMLANTVSKHNYSFTLLGVGGTRGLAADDTITIAGVVYTGKASETVASAQFKVSTGGSASQNIEDTAKSLVKVINRYSGNTLVYAYYESGYEDLPGKIRILERSIGGSSFDVVSSKGTAFNPILTATKTSSNDTFPNALWYSKFQEPEAFPLTNYILVGSKNSKILRIVALRDSLIILKDTGIYRLTGNTANDFSIEVFDTTTQLISSDSAVELNNQVYALTNQGVVAITDTGASILSRGIEDKFLELQAEDLTAVQQKSFAVPYESDRKYILCTITKEDVTNPNQCFVYNYLTNAWTIYDISKQCGRVNPVDDLLYMGNIDDNFLVKERKGYNNDDYRDEKISVNIVSSSGLNVSLTSVTGLSVGDALYQSSSKYSVITSINSTNNTVVVTNLVEWTTGAALVYKSIDTEIVWNSFDASNIGVAKQFREITMIFKKNLFNTADIGFSSDLSNNFQEVTVNGRFGLWGLFSWGNVAWGGSLQPTLIRTYVPLEKQRADWLRVRFQHKEAFSEFIIDGISFIFRTIGEKGIK